MTATRLRVAPEGEHLGRLASEDENGHMLARLGT
jgi:hypothetical protein